jgi:hypothetical protein
MAKRLQKQPTGFRSAVIIYRYLQKKLTYYRIVANVTNIRHLLHFLLLYQGGSSGVCFKLI